MNLHQTQSEEYVSNFDVEIKGYLDSIEYDDSLVDNILINYTMDSVFIDELRVTERDGWYLLKKYGYNRLLSVDKHLIIMAHKPINFLVTSGDVLHSFAVPALGIKVDCVPGRINSFYLEGSKLGKFYGHVLNYVALDMDLCL